MRFNDYVIIMAGGIGSRFWPMSRADYPKQFHDILGIGKSLLEITYDRFAGFIPPENIFIVTNQRYKSRLTKQLPELTDDQILLEPVGRNTAPCVAYAVAKIAHRDPQASIFVAASDHLIVNRDQFLVDAALALDYCRDNGIIMTLGIQPTRPDTGYGYIQFIEDDEENGFYKVKLFTEKPELEIAKTFVESGDFLWNSGMFIFSAKTILEAFRRFLPDMHDLFTGISEHYYTPNEGPMIESVYSKCLNISIDYGIMEKADNVYVIPSDFGWSDLGTWGSLYEHMEKDYLGNAVQGKAMVYESVNNVIQVTNKEKLVVVEGMEDFIVVDTGDVLMICRKENEQMIKEIVAEIKNNEGDKYT